MTDAGSWNRVRISGGFCRLSAILLVAIVARVSGAASPPAGPAATRPAEPPERRYLVLQNRRSSLPLERYDVRNDAWCLSGHALGASIRMNVQEFVEMSVSDIRGCMRRYLAKHPDLHPDTTGVVILDLEHPVNPRDLGGYLRNRKLYERIVRAFRVRISVAREALPRATLGLYGTVTTYPNGRDTSEHARTRMAGYRAAVELGLYDHLDVLVPSIYLAAGPTDPLARRLDAYTRLAIAQSRSLTRSDGTPIPLFPLLGFRVYESGSNHRREIAVDLDPERPLEATLARQVAILREEGIRAFGFWSRTDELEAPNPRGRTIMEHFELLFGPDRAPEGPDDKSPGSPADTDRAGT
jgi:hypothetical protein